MVYLAAIGGLTDQNEWTDGSRFQYSNFDHITNLVSAQVAAYVRFFAMASTLLFL